MLFNFVVFIAFLAVVSVRLGGAADVSGYWSSQDLENVKHVAQSLASSSSSSASELFYASKLLSKLGGSSSSSNNNCNALEHVSSSAKSPLEWFWTQASGDVFGCKVRVPASVLDHLQDSLSSHSLRDVAGGMLLGQQSGRLSEELVASGFDNLRKILTVNGELKLNVENARLVLEVLAAVRGEGNAAPITSELYDLALSLLPGGSGNSISDATLLSPLSKLTEKKVKISTSQIIAVAESLLPLKFADDAETLYYAFDALTRLAAYKSAPLFVKQSKGSFEYGNPASQILDVEVFNLLGEAITVKEVEVVSIKGSGKDTVYAEGLKSDGNSLSLADQEFTPGRYVAHLSVTVESKSNPIKHQGFFAIVDKVSIDNVHAGVTDSKTASTSDLSTVSAPNAFNGYSASALSLEVVHVTYSITAAHKEKARKPHQSFVRFTHTQTGVSSVFSTKQNGQGDDHFEYSASIVLGEEIANFNYLSGKYTISVLVGDATFSQPLEWLVGSIELKFPAKSAVNLPLYAKSLLHTSDNTLSALPEIEHQMRPPAKRASDFMAGTFTVLTIVPLLAFIVFNISLKPNFRYLRSLTSIAFVVCLAATLLMFSGYWLAIEGLSFYKTIKYLGLSFPVTLLLGYYSLNSVIKIRESREVEARKKN